MQPPSAMSRSRISIGSPGYQVICSTGWCWSSQADAGIGSSVPTSTGGMRALTLVDGPQFAGRREDVAVRRHVGVEVLEIEPGVGQSGRCRDPSGFLRAPS